MPNMAVGHDKLFQARANTPAPVVPVRPGYIPWQSVVTQTYMGVGFGGLQGLWALLARALRRLRPHFLPLWVTEAHSPSIIDQLQALDPERQAVVRVVLSRLTSARWDDARRAVRLTAVTPKFNRPEMWKPYSHAIKANAGRAENVFRHIRAVELLRDELPPDERLSTPEADLLAQLAYEGFTQRVNES